MEGHNGEVCRGPRSPGKYLGAGLGSCWRPKRGRGYLGVHGRLRRGPCVWGSGTRHAPGRDALARIGNAVNKCVTHFSLWRDSHPHAQFTSTFPYSLSLALVSHSPHPSPSPSPVQATGSVTRPVLSLFPRYCPHPPVHAWPSFPMPGYFPGFSAASTGPPNPFLLIVPVRSALPFFATVYRSSSESSLFSASRP